MESRAGRCEVVTDGASGISSAAFAARQGFLVGAKLADAARRRAGVYRHYGSGRRGPATRRRGGVGAVESAVLVARCRARVRRDSRWRSSIRRSGESKRERLQNPRVKLRVHCNFDLDTAQFSYSTGGREFQTIGGELKLPFQLKTFQGVRYTLFHFNTGGNPGGQADFDSFAVAEPRPRGLTKPIPYGRRISFVDLSNGNVLAVVDGQLQSVAQTGRPASFRVVDRGAGRIALQTPAGAYISVGGAGAAGEVTVKVGKARRRGDFPMGGPAARRYVVDVPGDASLPGGSANGGPARCRSSRPCAGPQRRLLPAVAHRAVMSNGKCVDMRARRAPYERFRASRSCPGKRRSKIMNRVRTILLSAAGGLPGLRGVWRRCRSHCASAGRLRLHFQAERQRGRLRKDVHRRR